MSASRAAMLALARESRSMTQSELARLTSLPQATISKVENGVQAVSDAIVQTYAIALRYPPSFFDQTIETRALPSHWRKKARATAQQTRAAQAQMNIFRMRLLTLLRSADVPPYVVPSISRGRFRGRPADAARLVREKWMLPRGPIANITRLLEDRGIVIVSCDLGTDDIDAMSVFDPSDDLPPCILVNPRAPGDRLRWSLCHELGHLILHTDPNALLVVETECEADEFASEFAMPAADIQPHLRSVTLERLANLKLTWRMSIASMIMAARRLDLIQERWERHLWITMGQRGWRMVEPNHVARDEPRLLSEIMSFFHNDLAYTKQQLAAALHVDMQDLRSVFEQDSAAALRRIK